MVEQGINVNKDVRHVMLAMTASDIEEYASTGWVRDGGAKVSKQPLGIDVIWYPRGAPDSPTVSATFFASPLNPDPLCRKTGEDIDNELANLPVISDHADPQGKVTHPYLKVETLLTNPQLDYNKGELDFLRSKPIKARTEWKQKSEIDRINSEFKRQQGLLGEKQKLLDVDETKAEMNPDTGEKWYPFTIAQVTTGGDKEHHGAQDPTKDGGTDTAFAVPPHEQEISNGHQTIRRMYDPSKKHLARNVRVGARSKEFLRV